MKNELQKHKNSDGIKWIATLLAVLMLAVAVTAAITQGFKNWNPYGWFDKQEEQPLPEENGGAIIGESTGNGVKVTSTKIPIENYAEYGISEQAESAYTLTAIITPDSATDKTVEWEVVFQNPASSWASEKNVLEYLTVVPTTAGSLTATATCLQPFAEKIVIKVISCDNPNFTANCIADYAQKITDISLKIGDIAINLNNGDTTVQWQVNRNGVGFGGKTNLTIEKNEVFTVSDTFTAKVELIDNFFRTSEDVFTCGGHTWRPFGSVRGDLLVDITSSGVTFDRAFLEGLNLFYDSRTGYVYLNNLSAAEFSETVSSITNGKFATVKVTVTGNHSSYSASSDISVSKFVNTASVSGIELDNTTVVF